MKPATVITEELTRTGCDGLVITHPATIRWLTGLESSHALVYADEHQMLLLTDSRYAIQAQAITGAEVHIFRGSLIARLPDELVEVADRRVAYQADRLIASEAAELVAVLPQAKLIATEGLFEQQIAVKSPVELTALAHAQAITDATFAELLDIIRPGITERELAAEIIYRQLRNGAEAIPEDFWPVVAFGERTALPHSHPTTRRLERNEPILLDFGCKVDGYSSDMTRNLVCGEPKKRYLAIYDIVALALAAALAAAHAGLRGSELDAVAREIIAAAGYGEQFGHALGHGIGLEAHEWPRSGPRYHEVLPEGAVMAIEPGIYLPGEFGVRIEDMIVLGKDRARNLTASPKTLIKL